MTTRKRRLIPLDRTEALYLAQKHPGFRGICRVCGCSEMNACTGLGFLNDESCSWVDREQTLCSNPSCLENDRTKGKKAKRG